VECERQHVATVEPRSGHYWYLNGGPVNNALRGDPHLEDLRRWIGLPPSAEEMFPANQPATTP